MGITSSMVPTSNSFEILNNEVSENIYDPSSPTGPSGFVGQAKYQIRVQLELIWI